MTMENNYVNGFVQTSAGDIPKISTRLNINDHLGTLIVRSAVNRNHYRVNPGLYAVGEPGISSDVFVTANYKLSFDHVRKNLEGLNAWILVLDTKGINVWCAAGKGTFSTKELVNRIKAVSLDKIVNHKRVIVPQLGAVGIAAHQVKEDSGFTVIYGPVRASDIQNFVKAHHKATPEMRKVSFTFTDRIKLIPVDFVTGVKYLFAVFLIATIISCISRSGISFAQILDKGLTGLFNTLAGYVAGIVITPMFLPYIPGRSFAFKGFISGMIASLFLLYFNRLGTNNFEIISWFLLISGLSSFLAMNFTGSSTFTSLSGVKKEMKVAVPLQISFSVVGAILLIIGKIF